MGTSSSVDVPLDKLGIVPRVLKEVHAYLTQNNNNNNNNNTPSNTGATSPSGSNGHGSSVSPAGSVSSVKSSTDFETDYTLKVSFLEIHNEEIRDLLAIAGYSLSYSAPPPAPHPTSLGTFAAPTASSSARPGSAASSSSSSSSTASSSSHSSISGVSPYPTPTIRESPDGQITIVGAVEQVRSYIILYYIILIATLIDIISLVVVCNNNSNNMLW